MISEFFDSLGKNPGRLEIVKAISGASFLPSSIKIPALLAVGSIDDSMIPQYIAIARDGLEQYKQGGADALAGFLETVTAPGNPALTIPQPMIKFFMGVLSSAEKKDHAASDNPSGG